MTLMFGEGEVQNRLSEYGDLLVAYLKMLEIDHVFGVPGGAIEPFVNALARGEKNGGPRLVMCRHETGSAFMADGYASSTGKLGVCFATTGPGTTNLVTGVASAYANNIPMLVITAQTSLDTFGKGALQESSCTGINTLSIFESITRYNSLVSHPDQFETKLAAAIMSAYQSPRGPVHLSVPIDVMKSKTSGEPQFHNLRRLVSQVELLDQHAFETFYSLLRESRRPVFVVGNEAGEAIGSILDIAVRLNIPVMVTPHGKGLISPYHPLFRGVIGFAGHQNTTELLSNPDVDLVAAIGTSLGEWASNAWDGNSLLNSRLIHIESSENHFIGSPMARLHVRGSIGTIFDNIKQRLEEESRDNPALQASQSPMTTSDHFHFTMEDEVGYQSNQSPILPQRLMAELPRMFPPNTRYIPDSGNSFAWAIHYLHPYDRRIAGKRDARGGLFKASLEFASMGWAIASAVGTALALPDTPVVCITGDGSYLMSAQEITVAIQHRLPVIYIILNDSAYGMVKHGQRLTGAAQVGFELPVVDYAAMAEAMGVPAHILRSVDDLQALDTAAICKRAGPTLLDVRIDAEAPPPIGLRTRVLKGGQ